MSVLVGYEPLNVTVELAQYDIQIDLPVVPDIVIETTGPMGPAGATLLSGTATPTGATGSEGFYYLDTDAAILYGPKAGSSWPIALQGVIKGTVPPTDLNAIWIDIN